MRCDASFGLPPSSLSLIAHCHLAHHIPPQISELVHQVSGALEEQGFYLQQHGDPRPAALQGGVVRTNCLDCLDRTNVVQTALARDRLVHLLTHVLGLYLPSGPYQPALPEHVADHLNALWADNGDALSFVYTGTGALKSSLTRRGKATVFGFLDDAAKSVNRFLVNTFQDKGKQGAIDLLLGKGDRIPGLQAEGPAAGPGAAASTAAAADFRISPITVFVGTWNVNGFCPGPDSNLEGWLDFRGGCVEAP